MIKNFQELKKQLEELSSVINSFESESVQLRIVKLIFKRESNESDEEFGDLIAPQPKKPRRRKKAPGIKKAAKDKRAKSVSKKKGKGREEGTGNS